MDRFIDTLNEKPIFSALFMMALAVFGAFALVTIAQQGRASFMDRSEHLLVMPGERQQSSASSGSNRQSRAALTPITDNDESDEQVTPTRNTDPLVIREISMVKPVFLCDGSSTTVKISGMRLISNSGHKGGTYAWKVDILSGLDYSTRDRWRGSVPAGETDYTVSYEGTDAGALYTRTFTHPHEEMKLRLRTVSPNDVTSQWFTIPASDSCR